MAANESRDLGTYWLRVELVDGSGWIDQVVTGARYTHGSHGMHPLTADRIPPAYRNEGEIIEGSKFMYLEGNFSCDCNKRLFLARAMQWPEPEELLCGDTLPIKRLTLIRPDGSELELLP